MAGDEVVERVVERLGDAQSEHLRAGVELAVDYALSVPLERYLDKERARTILTEVIRGQNAARLTERHLNPGRRRLIAHFKETGETPSDLVPEGTIERLEEIIRAADYPRAAWANGAITSSQVKELLAPIVQEILLSFTRKLPIPGGSGGESAPKKKRGFGLGSSIMDIGKGVLGDLQEKFQSVAREFSQQAMNEVRDAAVARLTSDEGRGIIRDMRDSLLERFLSTPVSELLEDGERLPIENLLDLAPAVTDHNRQLDTFATYLNTEFDALLEVEGTRPIRELLEENGVLNDAREELIARACELTAEHAQRKEFRTWLEALVAE